VNLWQGGESMKTFRELMVIVSAGNPEYTSSSIIDMFSLVTNLDEFREAMRSVRESVLECLLEEEASVVLSLLRKYEPDLTKEDWRIATKIFDPDSDDNDYSKLVRQHYSIEEENADDDKEREEQKQKQKK